MMSAPRNIQTLVSLLYLSSLELMPCLEDDEEGPSAPDTWLDEFARYTPVNFGYDGPLWSGVWNK
jgi:hypothetical protein